MIPERIGPAKMAPAARRGFLRRFARQPPALVAAVFLLLVIAAVAAAPLIAPYPANAEDLSSVLSGPSLHHLLGTDELGRDVLSRLLFGGASSLVGVGEAVAVAIAVGVPSGLVSGFGRPSIDGILSRLADIGFAMPIVVVLLVIFAVSQSNQAAVMITLGVLMAPWLFRVVRGATLTVKDDLYVKAARVSGLGPARILGRHVLPRIAGPAAVNCSVVAAVALITEAGLNYLGLGVAPPNPSWGGLVATAQQMMQRQSWLLVPSGAVIALTVIAFVLIGDGVRDALVDKVARQGKAPPVALGAHEVRTDSRSHSVAPGPSAASGTCRSSWLARKAPPRS